MQFKDTVTLGPTGSVQKDTVNIQTVEKAMKLAEAEEMRKAVNDAKPGSIVYYTIGEPVFNCRVSSSRKGISFKDGMYVVDPSDKNTIKTLDYFESQGRLRKEVKT